MQPEDTPPSASPSDVPPLTPPGRAHTRHGRRGAAATLLLVLATLWLAASVAAGIWLLTGTKTGAVRLAATSPSVPEKTSHSIYGGDAYTGIQNAAADTQNAVVDGTVGLAQTELELADSSAAFHRDLTRRLTQGLGVLVIGVGLLNFTVALTRFAQPSATA